MGLMMKEKKAVTKEVAKRYQRASKKQKGVILNEFIALTGYNRCYASYVLGNLGKRIFISKRRNSSSNFWAAGA